MKHYLHNWKIWNNNHLHMYQDKYRVYIQCVAMKIYTCTKVYTRVAWTKKYLVVLRPLVSPAVMICGWCKLTSDLDPHTCYGNSNWSSMQISPNLHFQVILQLDLRWPLTLIYDLWPHQQMRVLMLHLWPKFGWNPSKHVEDRAKCLHFFTTDNSPQSHPYVSFLLRQATQVFLSKAGDTKTACWTTTLEDKMYGGVPNTHFFFSYFLV